MYRKPGWDGAPRLYKIPTESIAADALQDAPVIPATAEAPTPAPTQPNLDKTAPATPAGTRAPRRFGRRPLAFAMTLKVATQEATVARMGPQIAAQEAAVAQAKTQLVSAEAAAKRAGLELDRQTLLVARDATSRQLVEQAQANRDQAVAAVQGAQAAIDSAAANVDVLKGQRQEAISTLAELKTALAKAERDLSFTVIRAPLEGVIGNRAVQTGDFVQMGQRLASLVPLDEVYVNANFKETQVARLRPGQTASIAVDALPDHAIQGTVESFAPASGAVFSLLPPDNATGNFTKIVQRLPVRIHVPPTVARQGLLRPGMSVVVSVNTKANTVADNGTPVRSAAAP